MKERFRSICSVFLALLLIASTVSWKVEKHYCMGHLVDMTFFADAEGCGMDTGAKDGATMTCCDDETIVIDGQDDLSISWDETSMDLTWYVAPNPQTTLFQDSLEDKRPLPNEFYPPPLLVEDIQLRDQVFLI